MTLLQKLKADFLGHAYYHREEELKDLDELAEFLDEFEIAKNYQNIFIHLNTPVELVYINDDNYTPVADDEIILKKKGLINHMANYHIHKRKDFYCGIGEPNNRQETEIQMFANELIKTHFQLNKNDTVIIPKPKIIITSEDNIAFPCIYDERTFTKKNLEQEISKLNKK